MNHPFSLPGPEINPSLLKSLTFWFIGLMCIADINWRSVTQAAAADWASYRACSCSGPLLTTCSFLGYSVNV